MPDVSSHDIAHSESAVPEKLGEQLEYAVRLRFEAARTVGNDTGCEEPFTDLDRGRGTGWNRSRGRERLTGRHFSWLHCWKATFYRLQLIAPDAFVLIERINFLIVIKSRSVERQYLAEWSDGLFTDDISYQINQSFV